MILFISLSFCANLYSPNASEPISITIVNQAILFLEKESCHLAIENGMNGNVN